MDFGLSGKVAMVGAASKGIGFAVARELKAEGCRLSICARDPQALGEACEKLGDARGYVCDVSRPEDIERWVQATRSDLGAPQILVTNTGGPPAGPVFEMTDDHWRQGFEGTVMNVVRLVRLTAPDMKARGWGRIVHVTSLVAKQPSLMLPISSTLRAGLMSLTRIQAMELAPFGVTVNSVLPGHTLTDRQVHLAQLRAEKLGISAEEALRLQADQVPMRRLADPQEIAAVVAFLCSARASFVTGESIVVDGGITSCVA